MTSKFTQFAFWESICSEVPRVFLRNSICQTNLECPLIPLVGRGWIHDLLVSSGNGFFYLSNKLPPGKIRCLEFVWSAASTLGRTEKEIHKIKLWKLALVSCLLLEETQLMIHGDLGLCFAIIYPRYLLKLKPICINDSQIWWPVCKSYWI